MLPIPKHKDYDLFRALWERKSHRKFFKGEISLDQLSSLFYFSAGIKEIQHPEKINNYNEIQTRRMYPSGGARYPLEIYLISFFNFFKLKKGIYHYNVKRHSLILLKKGDFKNTVKNTLLPVNRKLINNSLFFIIITSYFPRTAIKYGELAYNICLIEAGHLGQNLYLLSSALNIGCCALAGVNEEKLNNLLELEPEIEEVVYSFIFGNIDKK